MGIILTLLGPFRYLSKSLKYSTNSLHFHPKSRGLLSEPKYSYTGNLSTRTPVPDDKICWSYTYPSYKPVEFTAPSVLKQPVWADHPNPKTIKNFNQGPRVSHQPQKYKIDIDGFPQNPIGRTGIKGRGLLGKWGPNHAADPLVTRWKSRNQKVLEFIAIQRKDTGEWAIPGGMVDAGDSVSATLKKEFLEEAQNMLAINPNSEKAKETQRKTDQLFNNPTKELYKGYVDDPRNTDNAWMETCCYLFHDEDGSLTSDLDLEAGDDAGKVKWMAIDLGDPNFKLYASHKRFVELAVEFLCSK